MLSKLVLLSLITLALVLGASPAGAAAPRSGGNPVKEVSWDGVPVRGVRDSLTVSKVDLAFAQKEGEASESEPSDSPSGEGEEQSLEERLKRLEEELEGLKESQEELADEKDNFALSGHDDSVARVFGRVQADMWGFPGDSPAVNGFETGDNDVDPADRLGFRRLRIGVQGDLWKNMQYRVEAAMAGGNDFQFRDAYLGFKEIPFFGEVLIGNQKRPYNLDQINSSRYNVFMERPFIGEAFNEDVRRFGIVSYGFSHDQDWNWRYGWFNMRNIQDEGNYISDHWQSEFAARLARTLWYDEQCDGRDYGHWAIAGSVGDLDPETIMNNYAGSGLNEGRYRSRPEGRTVNRWLDTGPISGADTTYLGGLEGLLNIGPTQLVAEEMHVWVAREREEDIHLHGRYLYWSYFLTGEFIPWDRTSGQLDRLHVRHPLFCRRDSETRRGWGAWQVAVRWSEADFVDADIVGGTGEAWTFALNWHWNDAAKMQFNYVTGRIDNNEVSAVGGFDSGSYDIVGTRFAIDY